MAACGCRKLPEVFSVGVSLFLFAVLYATYIYIAHYKNIDPHAPRHSVVSETQELTLLKYSALLSGLYRLLQEVP